MKQSYPTGMVASAFKVPLTYEHYNQGRLLVPDMAHVVMPNEKLICGLCHNEISFSITSVNTYSANTCCGVVYKRRVHSYVIEAVLNDNPSDNEKK
jgi:hypothetical protein